MSRFLSLLVLGVVLAAVRAGAAPPAPVRLILDTDMSGDADDAGTLALLHALADRGECVLLAVAVNRRDLTNASAAAVDAINTYYGRPDLPIGTDKVGPTALQRTSLYAGGLRDGFPHGPTFAPGCCEMSSTAWFRSRASSNRMPPGCSLASVSNRGVASTRPSV